MKAIDVSRVSTEEQKEAGNSLPAQTERIRSYCERKGGLYRINLIQNKTKNTQ